MRLSKITEKASVRRQYDDACGLAHGLELVGERWALLVMRELFFGPRRFSDLRADLPGISANVLTQRLEGLEASGIVRRRKLPPPASVQVYELTEWGSEAEPIFQTLGRWAARSPAHDPTKPFSASSLMLSMRTLFDPRRAKTLAARIGFVSGGQHFVAKIASGAFDVAHGDVAVCDATFTGRAPVIAAAIYGGQALETLEAAGALTIDGERRLARKFVTLFPLPVKVAI